jgi:PIN domain nuclease of toxin-antitoxin system
VRFLLDTHLLLWAAARSERLPPEARALIEDPENDIAFSAASIWEIAIKDTLRRQEFLIDLPLLQAALPAKGFTELPVTSAHAIGVTKLPPIHRDPFDRLLVAQSLAEPAILLTNDDALSRYGRLVHVV